MSRRSVPVPIPECGGSATARGDVLVFRECHSGGESFCHASHGVGVTTRHPLAGLLRSTARLPRGNQLKTENKSSKNAPFDAFSGYCRVTC